MGNDRVISYIQSFPLGVEATYGATIADGSIDQLVSVGSGVNARLQHFPSERWDNAAHVGKGHEFPTSSENQQWRSEGQITDEIDTTLLGLLLKITMGGHAVGLVSGSSGAYDHVFQLQNPSSLQLPSSDFIGQDISSEGFFEYPGLVGESLILKGASNGYAQYDCTLVGNGKRVLVGAYSAPAFSIHRKLRDVMSVFKFGAVDSPVDYSADIVSWELGISPGLLSNDAVYPAGTAGLLDAADASKGAIASRMRFGSRVIDMKFTVKVDAVLAKTFEETNVATEILITSQGDEIESTFFDGLTIRLEDTRFTNVRVGEADELITYDVEAQVHMPASGLYLDLLAVTLRNGIVDYPVIAA